MNETVMQQQLDRAVANLALMYEGQVPFWEKTQVGTCEHGITTFWLTIKFGAHVVFSEFGTMYQIRASFIRQFGDVA